MVHVSQAYRRTGKTSISYTRIFVGNETDTDRRILRIWRKTAKQPDTVRDTCDRILTSLSIMMPKSRTADDGETYSTPILIAVVGNRWRRRDVEHHPVFDVFSCSRFERIQSASLALGYHIRWWIKIVPLFSYVARYRLTHYNRFVCCVERL